MNLKEVIDCINQVGFPIFLCLYLIFGVNRNLNKLNGLIEKLLDHFKNGHSK